MTPTNAIRVIVFKDDDCWVAQCLEHDICAVAPDLETLKSRLEVAVEQEIKLCLEMGKNIDAIPAAPKHFFDKWNQRSAFEHSGHTNGLDYEMALCA